MHALVLLLALPLAGCDGGGSDLDLSCQYDPHDWYDNATYTLLHADDQGAFDFDPIGDDVVRRKGTYDFETGDVAWTDTFAGGFYLVTTEGEGYGTIYDNGDLDLLAKHTTTDVLGEVWANRYRTERTECTGTIKVTEFDPELSVDDNPPEDAETTTYQTEIASDSEVRLHLEDTVDTDAGTMSYVSDTTLTDEVAASSVVDVGEGAYTATETWSYDATGDAEWAQYGEPFGADYDYFGTDHFFFDGSDQQDYTGNDMGSGEVVFAWSILWQYDGSGQGVYTQDEYECDVTFGSDGSCTYTCNDGSSGDCS